MRIPWSSDEHRNMCVIGEIVIMTLLIRDYKKGKKVEARRLKNLGDRVRDREQKHWETQREGGETR